MSRMLEPLVGRASREDERESEVDANQVVGGRRGLSGSRIEELGVPVLD